MEGTVEVKATKLPAVGRDGLLKSPYARYSARKVGWYFITFIIAVTLNFILPRLLPGNPVSVIVTQMMGGMTESSIQERIYESFMEEFGLDKPLWQQYLIYWQNLLQGDLGTSIGNYPREVTDLIASSLPWTLGLQVPAILVGWLVGNILGAFVAYRKGVFDEVIYPFALFLNSIPYFAMAVIMLYLFAVSWGWFPIGGGYDWMLTPGLSWRFIGSVLRHHTLPFLSLVVVFVGGQAIGMRSMSIYELNADYVLYSRLMGIRNRRIVRYVFRNAVLPQITGLALSLGLMVVGALITEIVFNYPGLGTWMFTAIRQQDYPLITGCTLVITIGVLMGNFILDMVYGLIDPRVKAAHQEEG